MYIKYHSFIYLLVITQSQSLEIVIMTGEWVLCW